MAFSFFFFNLTGFNLASRLNIGILKRMKNNILMVIEQGLTTNHMVS